MSSDMTTGGRSPHMPGGVDPDDLSGEGTAQRGDASREDVERDPLMGEAPFGDSTSDSPRVEPPD